MTSNELKTLAKEIVAEQMRYDFVGVEEASKILGISTSTLYKKVKQIPHGRFEGEKLRFCKADLVKLLG